MLLLTSSVAAAQPSLQAPHGGAWPVPAASPAQAYTQAWPDPVARTPPKSEALATGLAAGGFLVAATAIGVATHIAPPGDDRVTVWLLGHLLMVPGPSLGHLYANDVSARSMLGLAVRGGVLTLGAITMMGNRRDCVGDCRIMKPSVEYTLAAISVASAIYDIAISAESVRRYNARRQASWTVTPTVLRTAQRPVVGLALGAQF